jgi:hypothetical protein
MFGGRRWHKVCEYEVKSESRAVEKKVERRKEEECGR